MTDGPTIETLFDELKQVFARHNELFQDDAERALTVALQVLDERRDALGVDATIEPVDGYDCAMVRFGDQHTAMLGVSERTMSHFDEVSEAIKDQYDAAVLMQRDDGRLINPEGGRRA